MSRTRRIGGYRDGYTEGWHHPVHDTLQRWQRWIRLRHAPPGHRRMLNRLYRRKANREMHRYGEVRTMRPRDAVYDYW